VPIIYCIYCVFACSLEKDTSMQCHVLAFEGPDLYAQAGGVSSRVMGLTEALAAAGFEIHLWFVGDPSLLVQV
jgi:hypothetical protein